MEESVGVNAGAGNMPGTGASADDSAVTKVSKGFFRSFFAFLTYQRTTRASTTTHATVSTKLKVGEHQDDAQRDAPQALTIQHARGH